MRILPEVGNHLRNMISESDLVKLEAPNGCVYPVEVSREPGVIVLRSGWNNFVNAHHIEEDNSILFVYRGNSCFKVHVFNLAGDEKPSYCSPVPSGISGPIPPFVPCNHHVQNEQMVLNPGHVNSSDCGYTMLPGCCLTKAQDKKVLEIAHTTRSEIPLYVAAMSKSNVSLKNCYVYIPLKPVDSFKEEITNDVVQLQGPLKTVCVGTKKHSRDQIVLESGWNTFVVSHHIQEDDVLIFKSMETTPTSGVTRLEVCILDPSGREKTSSCSVMGNCSSSAEEACDDSVQIVDPPPPQIIDLISSDVLIFRSMETTPTSDVTRLEVCILDPNGREKTSSCSGMGRRTSSAEEACDDSVQIVDPPSPQIIDLISSDDDDIVREGVREPCGPQKRVTRSCAKSQKIASISSPSTKSGYEAHKPHDRETVKLEVGSEPLSNNLGGPSQPPYILTLGTTLHGQMKQKIEKKVQELRSEVPIFVKVMTISSVDVDRSSTCAMVFCTEYASACLPDKKRKTLFLQLEGKQMQWETTMEVRKDKWKWIYKGWREFVGQNGLEVGDICLFQLASRNAMSLTMTVHFIRKSEIEL